MERGGGASMWEINIDQLPLSRPQLGTWPATQACAPTGNETCYFLVCGRMPNPLSHTSQGHTDILMGYNINIKIKMLQKLQYLRLQNSEVT